MVAGCIYTQTRSVALPDCTRCVYTRTRKGIVCGWRAKYRDPARSAHVLLSSCARHQLQRAGHATSARSNVPADGARRRVCRVRTAREWAVGLRRAGLAKA